MASCYLLAILMSHPSAMQAATLLVETKKDHNGMYLLRQTWLVPALDPSASCWYGLRSKTSLCPLRWMWHDASTRRWSSHGLFALIASVHSWCRRSMKMRRLLRIVSSNKLTRTSWSRASISQRANRTMMTKLSETVTQNRQDRRRQSPWMSTCGPEPRRRWHTSLRLCVLAEWASL